MPAVALSRVGSRVVESGPGGGDLPADTWRRLEALPDPRSPRGRVYPLACLVAIAVCAFTAARNDRFTAIGQWVKRASQAGLARLRATWDPLGGRYRAPDEKAIRVVLDRLDPRALARVLLGGRRDSRRGRGGLPPASVRGYRARRAAGQSKSRGDLRRPPHRAGEPDLASDGQESPLHRDCQAQPAATARPGQGPALAAGTRRRLHPRDGTRPRRDPHREVCGSCCQLSRLSRAMSSRLI